ncbi:hypothetical protein [Nitratireductor basaltis]|uniref:Uncharacterized protein n=1 Tax=Nitratireductor basaltis TaxID=472175 RepID=A0A084UAS6_9HYPH|nr:hypothetical protein [Nitratireductor basaltis]KFB10062.1 hypothetical protein EL18_01090 [Nitratireductor basaltis]
MTAPTSEQFFRDLDLVVDLASINTGHVNVPLIANEMLQRYPMADGLLLDYEVHVLSAAIRQNAAVLFDRSPA